MPAKNAPAIATELFSAPALARRLRHAPPPDDVLIIVKAAAGDEDAISYFPMAVAPDPDHARAIAAFYLQQVHLRQGASDHHVLGLTPAASLEQIKEHKRWLLKWLHPDRNNNRWEQASFERISAAAARLENNLANPAALAPAPESMQQSTARHQRRQALHAQRRSLSFRRDFSSRRFHLKGKTSAILVLVALTLAAFLAHQLVGLLQSYFGDMATESLAMGAGN
jgi:hypothetical protein